jgi:hypothetical protein
MGEGVERQAPIINAEAWKIELIHCSKINKLDDNIIKKKLLERANLGHGSL